MPTVGKLGVRYDVGRKRLCRRLHHKCGYKNTHNPDIAKPLAAKRCRRWLSCGHPYFAFCVTAFGTDSIPQLSGQNVRWNANFWDFQLDPPPARLTGQ